MSDDQANIEFRVLNTIAVMAYKSETLLISKYKCTYCHSDWRETNNGHCINCGSTSKF